MSRLIQYVFPAGNTSDICLSQTTAGVANLVINGHLAKSGQVPFLSYGYSRSVSITSGGDIHLIVFTITGLQNGIVVSDTITNVNNNTVYNTTQVFDVITSISTSGAVASAITVGTGYNGFFPLIGINLERDIINYTSVISLLTANNVIQIAMFGGINNIVNNSKSYLTNITNNFSIFSVRDAAILVDNQFTYSNNQDVTFTYLLTQIIGTATTIGIGVKLDFLQI